MTCVGTRQSSSWSLCQKLVVQLTPSELQPQRQQQQKQKQQNQQQRVPAEHDLAGLAASKDTGPLAGTMQSQW